MPRKAGLVITLYRVKYGCNPPNICKPCAEVTPMTTLELKLDLPIRLAREAQAAGLLTPEGIRELLQDAMRRRAGETLMAAARNAAKAGGEAPPMDELVSDVKNVRAARKAAKPQ